VNGEKGETFGRNIAARKLADLIIKAAWKDEQDLDEFQRDVEARVRGVEARGEAAIKRVNNELDSLRHRVGDLERAKVS
jgi:hypothetical protein